MPLGHSICRHVVREGSPLVIGNAGRDPTLRGEAAVAELGIEAYLGFPVRNAGGHVFAALAAISHTKRDWREDDIATMRDLAAMMESELLLRSEILSRRDAERDLRLNEARLRSIADAAPAMMWQTDERGASTYRSRRWQEFTGSRPRWGLDLAGWMQFIRRIARVSARSSARQCRQAAVSYRLQAAARGRDLAADRRCRKSAFR